LWCLMLDGRSAHLLVLGSVMVGDSHATHFSVARRSWYVVVAAATGCHRPRGSSHLLQPFAEQLSEEPFATRGHVVFSHPPHGYALLEHFAGMIARLLHVHHGRSFLPEIAQETAPALALN
jgi:hypothetical protein